MNEHIKDAGATLVEYALIIALVVVACLGAIEFLGTEASNDMQNQSNCVKAVPGSPEAAVCGYTPPPTTIP